MLRRSICMLLELVVFGPAQGQQAVVTPEETDELLANPGDRFKGR